MKTFVLIILASVSILPLFGRSDSTNINSKIEEVTVFRSGAEIIRKGKVSLAPGNYILIAKDLPAELNSKSIQVESVKGMEILSVKHELHYPRVDHNNALEERLESEIESQEDLIKQIQSKLEVFQIEEDLLMDNASLGSQNDPVSVQKLREAADFYRLRINEIRDARFELLAQRKIAEEKRKALQSKLNRLSTPPNIAHSKIILEVFCESSVSGQLQVSYFVASAAWAPLYDFRVQSTDAPLEIVYNAHVFQTTGEDWEEVKLTLSNANPTLSGDLPELQSWVIDRRPQQQSKSTDLLAETGALHGILTDSETDEPLPFVNVLLMQNNNQIAGSATDFNGRYKIKPIQPGYYDIIISAVGYQKLKIESVIINSNKITFQDIALEPSTVQMEEFEVVDYHVPLIDRDGGASGTSVTRDDISRTPGRSARNLASNVRGARDEGVHYYLNGMKTKSSAPAISLTDLEPQKSDFEIAHLEYEIALPYSIPSDGNDYRIKIKETEQPVDYIYRVTPKLDNQVFLTAEITDWTALHLLNGPTSIYYNGKFIGESFIDTHQLEDTLSISLARESNVLVKRESDKELYERSLFGNNVKESIAFDIEMRNNLEHPITVVVQDQFPLSDRESIDIELLDNDATSIDHQRGIMTWRIQLDPSEQRTLQHGYTVKFPSDLRLYTN